MKHLDAIAKITIRSAAPWLPCLVALQLIALPAFAWTQYSVDGDSGNCADCHGNFTDGPYTSLVDNQTWPNSLHNVHRNDMLDGDCDACHIGNEQFFPVNLASSADKRWDMSGYGAYAATKEAIRSLTRAAACEWGAEGIRANVILPHAKSPGLAWWMDHNPEEAEAFVATIPQRRVGECEDDIGRFVALLCSEASSYVNGQSIALDGGQANLG